MLAKKSQKILLVAVGGIIVVSGLIVLMTVSPSKEAVNTEPTATPQPSPAKTPVKTSVKSPNPAVYTDLVKQYEGYRIQFDAACQAIPKSVTYKNGTKILLDNRSGDARNVSVGGVSHSLAGYGYKVITLSSTGLPKTLYLNCGGAVNVGQILLQN